MPDMGLYYYKSEEAQKAGEKVSGRVELLGVKISTEVEPKTGETIMILDSDFRGIKCVQRLCLDWPCPAERPFMSPGSVCCCCCGCPIAFEQDQG